MTPSFSLDQLIKKVGHLKENKKKKKPVRCAISKFVNISITRQHSDNYFRKATEETIFFLLISK